MDLTLRASNMLNDDVLSVYKSYGATGPNFQPLRTRVERSAPA